MSNAIEVYHAYFGDDKVKVIIEYAKMKREAFLKPKEKDVFDTGARLPEQKEESQDEFWAN